MRAAVDGVEQTLGADFTVAGVGYEDVAEVVFATAPASGSQVVLWRETPRDQMIDYQLYDSFPQETVEDGFNKQAAVAQELGEALARAMVASRFTGNFDARTGRIVNLGAPVDDQDAATKAWVESEAGLAGPQGPAGPAIPGPAGTSAPL